MCDCYSAKCYATGCAVRIPMHLEDYSTGREEVAVYCGRHIPADTSDGRVFRWSEQTSDKRPKRMRRCFIRALTANVRSNADGNTPNSWWAEPEPSPAPARRYVARRPGTPAKAAGGTARVGNGTRGSTIKPDRMNPEWKRAQEGIA